MSQQSSVTNAKQHITTCPLDCPDTCSLVVTIEDNKLTKLRGNPEQETTKGFACVKMYAYPERQHHKDRLGYPLKRVGKKGEGKFERVSWEKALADIAAKTQHTLDTYGANAILPYHYAGTMGYIERDHPLAFFRTIGACELDETICAKTGSVAWNMNYGKRLAPNPASIANAKLILLWGIDSVRSNVHLTPHVKAAQKNGARVIHIDPYKNETSKLAGEHLRINVGTDTALALAIGNIIFEKGLEDKAYLEAHANDISDYRQACAEWSTEKAADFCGLTVEEIEELALAYGSTKETFIRTSYGLTRNESGGNALRAITLLPALTGAWTVLGGGAMLSTSDAFALNKTRYSGLDRVKDDVRVINMSQLALALEDKQDPIKTLFVFNSNPAVIAPDSSRVLKGLEREDLFTVVLEHFQTDTADYADYILPATTFLEHDDLYSAYGNFNLQWAKAVLEPYAEAKPNSWVFQDLAKRLDLDNEVLNWSADEIITDLLDTDDALFANINATELKEKGHLKLSVPENYTPFKNGSAFPDSKIRFSPSPKQLPFTLQTNETYPLRLISPPGKHMVNSSMGNIQSLLDASGGEPQVLINPADATKFSIADQSYTTITSAQGSIQRKTLISDQAPQGTVIALGLWWSKLAPDKKGLNELSNETLTDLGGGSTFGNIVVHIEPTHSITL